MKYRHWQNSVLYNYEMLIIITLCHYVMASNSHSDITEFNRVILFLTNHTNIRIENAAFQSENGDPK